MKFVPPWKSGMHAALPSSFSTTGRPSAPISRAHPVSVNGLARSSSPLARSST
jgi:hypothetical protein